jgi:anthranilate phosphoribosyltransferase
VQFSPHQNPNKPHDNAAMGISHYIKEIGRGKEGARALGREQAADLFGQVLDGTVSDLEIGAFVIAMRIKGETADEMAGFLDASYARMQRLPAGSRPLVVLPSYNGARKLPVLTPLLGLLLARQGLAVLIHGAASESTRVFVSNVLLALEIPAQTAIKEIAPGALGYAPTDLLCPGLARLLAVRRVVGLRNPAHSLVKLMNPCMGAAVLVGSYTHPEYAMSMAAVFEKMGSTALLLRGTEGEPVADARRMPQMDGFIAGRCSVLQEAQKGSLASLPDLPTTTDALQTAAYIRAVLASDLPVPQPIARQVECILQLANAPSIA